MGSFLSKPKPKKCAAKGCSKDARFMAGLTPVCSVECAAAVGKKKAEDMRKQERIEYRRETQAIKAEFQRIEDIMPTLVGACNEHVRLRDWHKNCISCGEPVSKHLKNYHAGHIFHAGSKYRFSPLRVFESNIHGQCCKCNSYESGKQVDAMEGIEQRYGKSYLDGLKEYKRQVDIGNIKNLTYPQAEYLIKQFRAKTKELKKHLSC